MCAGGFEGNKTDIAQIKLMKERLFHNEVTLFTYMRKKRSDYEKPNACGRMYSKMKQKKAMSLMACLGHFETSPL